MAVGTYDYEWNQGEDLTINLIYKMGPPGAAEPVNLADYAFRMDIVSPDGKILYVTNDQPLDDVDVFTPDNQPDAGTEVTLGSEGQISIEIPRSLTLPGGSLYPYLASATGTLRLTYDMFLRDPTDKQRKIMAGTITVYKSITLWS